MTDDLCFTPATELAPLIRRKELSPVELIDAVLARIEACEPRINAFATLTAERARDAAQRAEAALTRGDATGSLFGLPVTIKDLTETAGIPTERGTHSLKGHVPTVDAPVIPRLEEAGAIILGKTTTSEFGWSGVSHSPLTGITSNPWKEGYNAGASSAGAGAAAAAGYGPLHQGSDGAGSIRMPSHFSGIFGLKPTYGRVPNWPVPNNDQISHVGPMTRTVGDAALMLQAMAGPHPWDHTSLEAGPADYPAGSTTGSRASRSPSAPTSGTRASIRTSRRWCRALPRRSSRSAARWRARRCPSAPRGRRSSACSGPSTSTPTDPCSPSSRTAWTPASSPASARRTG